MHTPVVPVIRQLLINTKEIRKKEDICMVSKPNSFGDGEVVIDSPSYLLTWLREKGDFYILSNWKMNTDYQKGFEVLLFHGVTELLTSLSSLFISKKFMRV